MSGALSTTSRDWAALAISSDQAVTDSTGLLNKPPRNTRAILMHVAIAVISLVSLVALVLGAIAISKVTGQSNAPALPSLISTTIKRLAFGSCIAYDIRPQPEWVQGVIKSKPDAWIWMGDMAYLDVPTVNCSGLELGVVSDECQCSPSFLHTGTSNCKTGDPDVARERFIRQLYVPEYQEFLRYMCPGYEASSHFPPTGSDPTVCSKPILGVWDDHDYGWNNGNHRLPHKHVYKQLFLDAIGEPMASPRRNAMSGIQASYKLSGGKMQVVLLDERYFRDTLPCQTRRAWCEKVLANSSSSDRYTWCVDFLQSDGTTGAGSCCSKDERMAVWCQQATNRDHKFWRVACDPTSSEFGSINVMLTSDGQQLLENSEALYAADSAVGWRDRMQTTPFCDLLGMAQRAWLRRELAASSAELVVVGSGSVLAGSMGYTDKEGRECSEDDWYCYRPAQVNLVHTLSNLTQGCVVVLTGDYHYGDIKIIQPNSKQPYADMLHADKLRKPIYQLMSSGMTNSTAHPHDGCSEYRKDYVGLRPFGECSMTLAANFGMLEVDWKGRIVALQLRDSATGELARDASGRLQELRINLNTCQPVQA